MPQPQVPQYTPLANGSVRPGQNYPVYFGNGQMTPPGIERPMTYQEFLASRGMGQGNYQTGAQQPNLTDSAEGLAKKYSEREGQSYLESLMSGGGGSAAGTEGGLMASGAGVGVADAAGASTVFSGGTSVAGTAVGTAANGGTIMSTGAVVPASAGTPIASGGAAGAGAGGAFSLGGIGSAGNVILPAAGALGAYDLYANQLKTGNKKRGAAQGAASGAAMGSYFGPWGAVAGGVIGAGVGLTAHESTKDTQKRRWGGLSEQAQQLFSANHPEGDDGIFKDGKYKGQKWSFEKAADLAKDDPNVFRGVYGNMSLGDEFNYLGLSDELQKEFVRQNLAAGNYDSKKGDVILKDHNKGRDIFKAISSPDFQIPITSSTKIPKAGLQVTGPANMPNAPVSGQVAPGFVLRDSASNAPAPVMIPRSKTKSPGIGLDGKPIPQWRR